MGMESPKIVHYMKMVFVGLCDSFLCGKYCTMFHKMQQKY